MHRHTGWLIDGDQGFVFHQHLELASGCWGVFFGLHLCGDAHGRNTDQISRLYSLVRRRTPFVHPHLTRTDDAVDMGFGHALEMAHQKIVEPLPRRVVVHG